MSINTLPRPDGNRPRVSPLVRLCGGCGKRVSKYKNPCATKALCYCCEDKLPWTYALIVGGGSPAEDPMNRRGATIIVSTDDPKS